MIMITFLHGIVATGEKPKHLGMPSFVTRPFPLVFTHLAQAIGDAADRRSHACTKSDIGVTCMDVHMAIANLAKFRGAQQQDSLLSESTSSEMIQSPCPMYAVAFGPSSVATTILEPD